MIERKPIPVRPRVFLKHSSGPLLLDVEIQERLDAQRPGLIELVGPPGSGKSYALAHLAICFPDHPFLTLADSPSVAAIASLEALAGDHLVVYAAGVRTPENPEPWRLAPWSQDEWIEYLLATHRDQCKSVMRRVQADRRQIWLRGLPEIWRAALDRLADDESLPDVASALLAELRALLANDSNRGLAGEYCLRRTAEGSKFVWTPDLTGLDETAALRLIALLRHEQSKLVLAADFLIDQLRAAQASTFLGLQFPRWIVENAAAAVAGDSRVLDYLRRELMARRRSRHAMEASILHAAGAKWTPRSGRLFDMTGAYLPGIRWFEARLTELDLSRADLTAADLRESRLVEVRVDGARLSRANFSGAKLRKFFAADAVLADADLSFVRAHSATFLRSDLSGANLEGALLRHANFAMTNLQRARFCRADLSSADLRASQLDEADFSCANLNSANLARGALRVANFAGATFARAILSNCDLEGMELPGANFEAANLTGSYLSGSRMPGARFFCANLTSTGLADIEWERADLRGADLRGATFHLGSSRSGLVGSPLACEGSRTGFYTDEYHEQDFRSPEEIRKANLRRADLRGALIDGVDFYLVDLRNAIYTPDQEEQFRACRAILETRV